MELSEKTVKIKGKEYTIRKTVASLMEFESIIGHPITKIEESYTEMVTLFFCLFKAGGNKVTYEEFIQLLDDDTECISAFFETIAVKGEKKQIPV